MGEILASRAVDSSLPARPLLDATLVFKGQSFPLSALLDSGADESFIDHTVCRQLGIETEALDVPRRTTALTGMPLAKVDRRTVPVSLHLSGNH